MYCTSDRAHIRLNQDCKNLLCSALACIFECFWYSQYETHGWYGFSLSDDSDDTDTMISIINSMFTNRCQLSLRCECVRIVGEYGNHIYDGCSFETGARHAISFLTDYAAQIEDCKILPTMKEDKRRRKVLDIRSAVAEIKKWAEVKRIIEHECPAAFGDMLAKIKSIRSRNRLADAIEENKGSTSDSIRQLRSLGFFVA